jgi:hypothetical protein
MSAEDFARRLAVFARDAADGESVERSMSLARMMSVHYRPWHHRAGRPQEDHMAIRDMGRRLDRLGSADGHDMAGMLQEACHRQAEREQAWKAEGREGRPPHGPMLPIEPQATRSQREMWRKLAHGRARALHMGHETDGTSPFESLAEAYALSDDELLAAINSHPSAQVWP